MIEQPSTSRLLKKCKTENIIFNGKIHFTFGIYSIHSKATQTNYSASNATHFLQTKCHESRECLKLSANREATARILKARALTISESVLRKDNICKSNQYRPFGYIIVLQGNANRYFSAGMDILNLN